MRTILLTAAFAVLAPGLLAQEDPGVSPAAAEAYTKLVAEYDAAMANYRQAVDKVSQTDEYKAALKSRDRDKINELRQKMPRFDLEPFLQLAAAGSEEFAGTEGAVDFLVWTALHQRDKDAVVAAVDTLMDQHFESARLEGLITGVGTVRRYVGPERCQEILLLAGEKSPHALVRAQALFATYNMLSRDRKASPEAKAKAEAGLVLAAKLAEGTALADRIQGPLFVKQRLQIGMVAPDIEGEDLDGVPFKLSDYRGKVVVIDFWGDW